MEYSYPSFGNSDDIPLTGDFDGDGKTDIAVWRPSAGYWFIVPSSTGAEYAYPSFGNSNDIPLTGDFDGDGKTDLAVWRPSDGYWFILPSSTGVEYSQLWGIPGDTPLQDSRRRTLIAGQVLAGGTGLSGDVTTNETADFEASFASGSSGASSVNGFYGLYTPPYSTPNGSGCGDISGSWTVTNVYGSSTWNLAQNGSNVSGTVDYSNGPSCGTITYQTVTAAKQWRFFSNRQQSDCPDR